MPYLILYNKLGIQELVKKQSAFLFSLPIYHKISDPVSDWTVIFNNVDIASSYLFLLLTQLSKFQVNHKFN